jgi:hypothetical protein
MRAARKTLLVVVGTGVLSAWVALGVAAAKPVPATNRPPSPSAGARQGQVPVGECTAHAFAPKKGGGALLGQGRLTCVGQIDWMAIRVCLQRYAGTGNQWITTGCNHKRKGGPGRISIGVTHKCKRSAIRRNWRTQVLGTAVGGDPPQSRSGYAYNSALVRCR